ncbi:MAG: hypothetical protein NE334_01535 [Lentisphaeraceae bacterium]|nr:hypothetical protein [Lentisphaeraceae bacterium]
MKNGLIILLFIQIVGLGYLLSSSKNTQEVASENRVQLYVEMPLLEEQTVELIVPEPPVEQTKKYEYRIPNRRIISGNGVELDKNVNAIGTLGEELLENPLMVRSLEKLVRDQFFNFYGDFIKEADLSPYEQAEFFKLMSQVMQQNMKSLMKAIGENMGEVTQFRNGPPPSFMEGVKENNLVLKSDLIGVMGEEKFGVFEQYYKEKSAAEEFLKVQSYLKRSEMPLNEDQSDQLRQVFLDQHASPFDAQTYEKQINYESSYNDAESVLNKDQQKKFKQKKMRHNRVYLLPF